MKNEIGIIIQARTGSSRLPNKILKPFYNQKCILELIVEKISSRFHLPIIIATTNSKKDDKIIDLAIKNKTKFYRGNETNVLDRFIKTAEKHNLNSIIRICSDNPFLDIKDISILIDIEKNIDYGCFTIKSKPTIQSHYGLWTERVSLNALKKIANLTNKPIFLEHVTNFIYSNPNLFNIHKIEISKKFHDKKMRLTVDTKEDFLLLKEIYFKLENTSLNNKFDKHYILDFLDLNPHYYIKMNKNIFKNEK